MSMSFGFATTSDGARISYVTESGVGTPFLLANPLFYPPIAVWLEQPSELADLRALADGGPWYAFDWRGVGRSSPIHDPLTLQQLASDVGAIADLIGAPVDLYAFMNACPPPLRSSLSIPGMFAV